MNFRERARTFCDINGLKLPILLAPMAGANSPELSIAVGLAGGMGACGALLMKPQEVLDWADEVRGGGVTAFQLNLWIPDPAPKRDPNSEAAIREFLGAWGPTVPAAAGDAMPPDFSAQCKALLAADPPVISSVMGLYSDSFIATMKDRGIKWFATVSTVGEAKDAEAAGADVIIAQGMEAGGHRAAFDAESAEAAMVGLIALVPAVVDAVSIPVVATGGIADGRGAAAAFALGASAVQIGTAFLRSPESNIDAAWASALGKTAPEDTRVSRVFSGRAGRSILTDYVRAALSSEAPPPAPYPVQRGFTAPMRAMGYANSDIRLMQAWAGQAASIGSSRPAGDLVKGIWQEVNQLLS